MAEQPSTSALIVPARAARGASGTPIDVLEAAQQAGMGFDRPFSPGQPLAPFDGYSRTPRSHDFQTGYNIAARPRRNERVAFDTLKGLIEGYDVAQMCIWHRIDSIRSLSWSLVAREGAEGEDISRWVEVGMAALKKPDRQLRFKAWLTKYLYDVLAYDAGAIYRMRNNAGRAIGLKVVDGTTIAPLLDIYGDTPMAERAGEPAPPAYVQYAQGVPWGWLTTDDLIYEPFRPTSGTPYGKAPIETILLNANTDLRFQAYFIGRFTEGNIPEGFATSPEGWTPEQIEAFQASWDAFMLGDEAVKNQIKWVPSGTEFAWSNEKEFTDTFSLFLMRKTAAAYHVTPQDLGFTEDVNRATSDTQVDNQFRIGDLPLVEHVQDIIDGFLQDDLGLPLAFQFDTGQEKEDRLQTAQADKIYVEMGAVGVSEVRERVYGLSEPDGQPVPRYVMTSRSGPVPLSALKAVAGEIDPASGAPAPGAQLPHKPFAPIEGVTPQKPPSEPPLAVVQYPQDNPASVDAAIANAAAPVEKEAAAGVTVTGGTVAEGYDLIGDDDDEEEPAVDVAKAAELASFRRFTKARRRDGRWRDFQFTSVGALEARRLNDQGRAAVRKAAGQLVAAGLCVRAADSGRVLMLQRGLDPTDPASGMWEFPGGHIDDGETPLAAAVREWQEETGCLLPADALTAGEPRCWTGSNGLYQGFVVDVAAESVLSFANRSQVTNPDDPDGDSVEAVAWWDPATLPGNPFIRAELAVDAANVLEVAGAPFAQPAEGVVKAGGAAPKASWRDSADKVPQHAFDLKITDHYAPLVSDALRALYPESLLRSAVEHAASLVVKAVDPETVFLRDAARTALGSGAGGGQDLEGVLRQVFADAYGSGAYAAGQQLGHGAVTLQGVAGVDWSTWQPGDALAADLASNGGLSALLDQVDVTVRGISGSLLEQLGNTIGDGLASGRSVDSIAGDLAGIVSDPSRAEMIAHTETARATTAATMESYRANGVALWDWVLSDGACPECEAEYAANPHSIGGEQPPLHPRCRCAASPVVESVQATGSPDAGGLLLGDTGAVFSEEAASSASSVAEEGAAALDLTALSDDDLAGRLAEVGDDEQAMQAVLEELDRRDAAAVQEQRAADKAAKAAARKEADLAEKDARYEDALAAGDDPLAAYADIYGKNLERVKLDNAIASLRANGFKGRGFDELCRDQFKDYAARSYLDAETETHGFLLNEAGRNAGIDPASLFSGPESRARKYASDELLSYWQRLGRLTVEDFKISNLGGKAAYLGQADFA